MIKYGFKLVYNGAVSKSNLPKDGIHLLKHGKAIIVNNFINNINCFLGNTNLMGYTAGGNEPKLGLRLYLN